MVKQRTGQLVRAASIAVSKLSASSEPGLRRCQTVTPQIVGARIPSATPKTTRIDEESDEDNSTNAPLRYRATSSDAANGSQSPDQDQDYDSEPANHETAAHAVAESSRRSLLSRRVTLAIRTPFERRPCQLTTPGQTLELVSRSTNPDGDVADLDVLTSQIPTSSIVGQTPFSTPKTHSGRPPRTPR